MAFGDETFNIKVVSTADTSGIKQTKEELDQLAARQARYAAEASKQAAENARQNKLFPTGGGPPGGPPGGAGGSGGGPSGTATDIGRTAGFVLAGSIYAFVDSLKKASAEIAKVSEDLDKQGAQLVANAQRYDEQARHAKDISDVLKVSDATLKDIASTQKKFNDLSTEELGRAAKFSDYLQTQMLARQRAAGIGDYEAARRENLETALSQYQAARQRGMAELLAAEKAANQTLEEKIAILNREIAAEERRKQVSFSNTDPGGYAKAGNNLLRLKKDLEDVNKLKQKFDTETAATARKAQEDAYGATSPQARAILRNEQAARDAKSKGDDKSAEQFQATADKLKEVANATDLQSYQDVIKSYGEAGPVGRKAGVGESQALVDEQERNRLAALNQPVETGTGGPSLIGEEAKKAREASLGDASQADVEYARQVGLMRTAHESKQAAADREEANARLRGENRAGEIERETQNSNRNPDRDTGLAAAIKSLETKFDRYWGP